MTAPSGARPLAPPHVGDGLPQVVEMAEVVLGLARLKAEQKATVLVNTALIALAILAFALVARRLARPPQRLIHIAKRVGAGRTGVQVPVEGVDAVGQLVGTLNRMVDDLRGPLAVVRRKVDRLSEVRERRDERTRRR